jgi:uncharacterized membrane protein
MVTILDIIVTVLCGVGLYASVFMLGKTYRAARGRLAEPSVVQTPRARLYGGVPNALLGAAYYLCLGVGVWFARSPAAMAVAAAAVAFAAVTSVLLAYSLLYVTRRPCPYCWTAHAINWSLAVVVALLFKTIILSFAALF